MSRRGAWWIAVVVSTCLLVGAALTAVVNYLHIESPTQVTRSYFAALEKGNAARALGYGRPVSGDTRYLNSTVLAAQLRVAPIGAPTVLGEQRTGTSSMLRIRYAIGSEQLTETIALHRSERRWRLDTPAALVQLDIGPAGNRANLAGLAVPTSPVALFPGAVPIAYDTDRIRARADSDRVTLTASGTLRVIPELTDTGRTVINTALRTAMTSCLTKGAQAPASCPLTPSAQRSVPASLRGSVQSFVGTPSLVSGDADGLVQVLGTFSINGTWLTLDFNNQTQSARGVTSVAINARTYVTAPTTVAWMNL